MLDLDNWYNYNVLPPPKDILCKFCQTPPAGVEYTQTNIHEWIGYAKEFFPEMNRTNLYWKYTGIGREQLGWSSQEVMDNKIRSQFRNVANCQSAYYTSFSLGQNGGHSNCLMGIL